MIPAADIMNREVLVIGGDAAFDDSYPDVRKLERATAQDLRIVDANQGTS